MPEPAVPRPRSRPKPEPVPAAAPQSALADLGEVERRMLAAIEDVHAGARLLGLPPQALRLEDRNGARSSIDPERISVVERVDARLADLEAMATGPQPVSLAQVAAPADPDAFLVSGFIRPGTTVMMTGAPGSSKSWAARQLALCCAAGLRTYLDRYEVSRPLNVLVVDEDNGPDEEWRREEALLATLRLKRSQLARVHRTSLAGVHLDEPSWQSWLRGLVLHLELDLVVLDPISEMHGGKELREDPAFRGLLGFLKRLKVDFPRLATLLVHHTRKAPTTDRSGPKTVDDVRGQWGQTPDVVALMGRLPERRISWELHKRVPYSRLILEATERGPLQVLSDESTQRDKTISRDDRVLTFIEAGATTADEIITASGIPKATVYRALKSLRTAGLITQHEPIELVEDRTDDPIDQEPASA